MIIGNPLSLPRLNSTNKIERLFDGKPGSGPDMAARLTAECSAGDTNGQACTCGGGWAVLEGGFLDLRTVMLFRGAGRSFDDGTGAYRGHGDETTTHLSTTSLAEPRLDIAAIGEPQVC